MAGGTPVVKALDSKYTQGLDSHRVKSLLSVKMISCVHVKMRERGEEFVVLGYKGLHLGILSSIQKEAMAPKGRGAEYKLTPQEILTRYDSSYDNPHLLLIESHRGTE